MPTAIQKVVDAVASIRQATTAQIEELIHNNFVRMITDDVWLEDIRGALSR
jgi:Tat protein secretion system quality control protein TatD with DNase activity